MEKEVLASKMTGDAVHDFKKQVVKISWPIFVEFALFALLGSIDIFMLGKYSDNAVAAVGVVNQVMNMVILVFQIITSGTMIICSQYIGANKKDKDMHNIIGTSIIVNIILGIVLSLIMFIFGRAILNALDIAEELMPSAISYMKIVGGLIFVQALISTFDAVIRSFGFTKQCMYISIIMNIVNIAVNYTLIYGNFGAPELGVSGAAIGTVVSRIIATIIAGYFLFSKVIKNFKIKYLIHPNGKEFMKVLTIGLPSAGESIAYNIAKLMCTVILNNISVTAVTTNSYINNIIMYIYLFACSLGQGTAILVGRLVGKGKEKEAYKLCFASLKKGFIASIILATVVALSGKYIFGIFTTSEEIISLGVKILFMNILLETGRTFNVIIINCLRAAGDVRFPVYVGVVSMWSIGVGLAYILAIPLGFGFVGMWFALALDEWVRGIIMYFRWKSNKWHGKAVI